MTHPPPKNPLIFDIARASFVDGPGVRTTVFFKGCPLTCPWCHNPESQSYEEQVMLFPENCIHCGSCEKGKPCFSLARQTIGHAISPDALIQLILEDTPYYDTSGGGVTFSGGEAFSFIQYLACVLPALKKEHIHIAVQTCGYFDFDQFALHLLPHIDMIYFDLKIMDDNSHRRLLGKSNRIILENFKHLLDLDILVVPRIPLVPNFVATVDNLNAIARFLTAHKVSQCEFLYYHMGAREKLIRLNRAPIEGLPEKPVSIEENRAWMDYFNNRVKMIKQNRQGKKAALLQHGE